VENIAYTLKEINAVGSKSLYNAAVICPPSIMSYVKEVWDNAFEYSELFFIHKKETRYSISLGLINSPVNCLYICATMLLVLTIDIHLRWR
jgi:hypothetical protein